MAARARRRRRLDDDVGGLYGPWLKLAYVVFLVHLFNNIQAAKTPGKKIFCLFYNFILSVYLYSTCLNRKIKKKFFLWSASTFLLTCSTYLCIGV